jgi:hypothetical protein
VVQHGATDHDDAAHRPAGHVEGPHSWPQEEAAPQTGDQAALGWTAMPSGPWRRLPAVMIQIWAKSVGQMP